MHGTCSKFISYLSEFRSYLGTCVFIFCVYFQHIRMRRLTFQGLNNHRRSWSSRGQGGSKGTGVPSGVQESWSPTVNLQSPVVLFLSVCRPSNLCPFVCLGHYRSQSWSSFLAAAQHILFLIICCQVNRRQRRKSISHTQFSHISKSSNSRKFQGQRGRWGSLRVKDLPSPEMGVPGAHLLPRHPSGL